MASRITCGGLGLWEHLDLVDAVARRQEATRGVREADETLAVLLALVRAAHGTSVHELARRTGLSRREVARLLRAAHGSAR